MTRKKKAPKETKGDSGARTYHIEEVDPALENPKLLDAIREKNKDAMAYALNPNHGQSKTSKPNNTAETAWYFTNGSHHVTGNLDLLTDITPVTNRWVRGKVGGPLWQVLARGSVNNKGIILHDVWFVPDCDMNLVSGCQLALMLWIDSDRSCSLVRHEDEAIVGKGHIGASGSLEMDFINLSSEAVWHIAANASQHMTGNLHLLTDFKPIRPSYTVQTHTGARLQVCGKGSVKSGPFSIPNVSYVPGLSENIISVSQLSDSGFTVTFGADGFTVKKHRDGNQVGWGTYGGSQLFHLNALIIPTSM